MRANRSPSLFVILARIVGSSNNFSSSVTPSTAWAPPPSITIPHRRVRSYANSHLRHSSVSKCRFPTSHRGNIALRSTSTTTSAYDGDNTNDIENSNSNSSSSKQPKKNTSFMPPLSSSSSPSSTFNTFNLYNDHLQLANEAMQFIDNSPDPFHVIQSASMALESAGFIEWNDIDGDDALHPGGKYYFTRNKSTLVAFAIGNHYQPSHGFKIIGSHTDSPNLKIKPYSKRTLSKDGGVSGMMQLSVECYGGGLWHTWFDRDLGVSGRVFVREEDFEDAGGDNESKDDGNEDNSTVAAKSRRIRQVRQAVIAAYVVLYNALICSIPSANYMLTFCLYCLSSLPLSYTGAC
jgi:hypothetical protein